MSRFLPLLLFFAPAVCAQAPVPNRAPLQKGAFTLLPLTSVKPKGWLREQLRIQADGLSGHLDEFWPSVGADSGWLGGNGESWERGPYYTDGLVPLAFLLEDPKLIAKAAKWVNWTLNHQRPDGSIGPEKNTDWWPNMVMLKALTQYQEATGDARVIPLMERYLHYQLAAMPRAPLRQWAIYRWADEVVSVLWLYNRTGDPRLLELAELLGKQGHDWKGQFAEFRFTGKMARGKTTLATHVVNNAMALKTSAVWWLVSGDPADRAAVSRQLGELDRYHLLPNGVHSGDEHYAGRDPSQGTELCAVVEAVFSLEHILAALGDPALGDRLEKIAYNPLPGTFTGDMWAHQYDRQPNQVLCNIYKRRWTNNGPDSNLFGLEPNFGCCTSNFHQGWPKFAANLWMASADGGLAAVAYGPSEVSTMLNGARVSIEEETEYPFGERIVFNVRSPRRAKFPLLLRVPGWAEGAAIAVNGKREAGVKAGTFHRLERVWAPDDRIELTLPMRPRVTRWYRDSAAIERGPLVYSLKMGEEWRKIREFGPSADWEVYPTTAWNYGLKVDLQRPESSIEVVRRALGRMPFRPDGAPLELRVKGRRIPEWKMLDGSAGPVPQSPAASAEPLETLTLIPYGAAKLRITAFPLLKE